MSEEYEYIFGDPNTYRVKRAPVISFLKSEEDEFGNIVYPLPFSGLTPTGKTFLRIVWGGTHKEPRADGLHVKHYLGRWPQDTIRTATGFIPYNFVELGNPRWIVEVWTSPEKLAEGERFSEENSTDEGKRVLREFPRQGVYDHWWTVTTAPRPGFPDGKFRHFDEDVLEVVREMWRAGLDADARANEAVRRESLERTAEERERELIVGPRFGKPNQLSA
jgi:hypothetical protein